MEILGSNLSKSRHRYFHSVYRRDGNLMIGRCVSSMLDDWMSRGTRNLLPENMIPPDIKDHIMLFDNSNGLYDFQSDELLCILVKPVIRTQARIVDIKKGASEFRFFDGMQFRPGKFMSEKASLFIMKQLLLNNDVRFLRGEDDEGHEYLEFEVKMQWNGGVTPAAIDSRDLRHIAPFTAP